MTTGRLDTLRAWFGRLLVSAVIIAAGVVIASLSTTSSAPMMTTALTAPTTLSAPDVDSARLGANTPTGAAVAALTGPRPADAIALIPSGFADEMGYRPVLIDGVPANPDGGCSSPIAMPMSFDAPCKTHDLGYDLLRYGALTGSPLGPWARESLDRQLSTRMHASCVDDGCQTAADLADAGVGANSRRQGDGVPVTETDSQIVTSTLRMIWEPVSHAAGVLGTAPGRATVAALIAMVAIHLRRRSRPLAPGPWSSWSSVWPWPSVWSVITRRRVPAPDGQRTPFSKAKTTA
ncbi:hypothetical protein OG579_05595 [Williamsia herbipolensis]|uniref:Prokaryotic phospholipase A2 n=1 Tax=Williamsia herbipolensis TaxID=1603258 RepID=A0AAU4K5K5_9NOCA|nr:hypothetical protein [Williamsia herbipolensis]